MIAERRRHRQLIDQGCSDSVVLSPARTQSEKGQRQSGARSLGGGVVLEIVETALDGRIRESILHGEHCDGSRRYVGPELFAQHVGIAVVPSAAQAAPVN